MLHSRIHGPGIVALPRQDIIQVHMVGPVMAVPIKCVDYIAPRVVNLPLRPVILLGPVPGCHSLLERGRLLERAVGPPFAGLRRFCRRFRVRIEKCLNILRSPAGRGEDLHPHDQDFHGHGLQSVGEGGEQVHAVRRPPVVELLVLLRFENALQNAPRLAHNKAVIDTASVLNAHDILKAALPEQFYISQRNDVRVHVRPSVLVQLCSAYKVRFVRNLEDLGAGEGVCRGRNLVMLHVRDGERPARSLISLGSGMLPLLRRSIGMDVNGVRVKVETGRVDRDEYFELEGEMLTPVEQPDIVGNIGYRSIRGLGLDDGHNAGNTARLMCRHYTGLPEPSELGAPGIIHHDEHERQNCGQGSKHIGPGQARGAPHREPDRGLGVLGEHDVGFEQPDLPPSRVRGCSVQISRNRGKKIVED